MSNMCKECSDALKEEIGFLATLLTFPVSEDVKALANDVMVQYLADLYIECDEDVDNDFESTNEEPVDCPQPYTITTTGTKGVVYTYTIPEGMSATYSNSHHTIVTSINSLVDVLKDKLGHLK